MRREGIRRRQMRRGAEAELDVIYTQPTSGSSRRRRSHYPPSRKLPFPCGGSVSFHIKTDPLLLRLPAFLCCFILWASHWRYWQKKRLEMSLWWSKNKPDVGGAMAMAVHVKTLEVAGVLWCDRRNPEAAGSQTAQTDQINENHFCCFKLHFLKQQHSSSACSFFYFWSLLFNLLHCFSIFTFFSCISCMYLF